ncbi:hypothetical protein [Alkalihalobacillus sp. LMS39]|uniref:hypothetical protein n=1 Tax=Alkalihalobacillus sp. LMS39 TaxID=2924032 RepID=UPI001FB51782|nr:hypothetical protein [Alkalihalobacillus sp. LMS39]UOE94319.1 hypothetical protein MM271_01120 [Alkalihalobacillus sp. LMS39]
MNKPTITLLVGKKPVEASVTQLVIYAQSQIVEAHCSQNQLYYILFYKEKMITAVNATRIRRYSHMEHALKNGITFPAPHPLLTLLLSSNKTFPIMQKSHISSFLTSIQRSYDTYETALIYTYLESFVPKKLLFEEIQQLYFQCRRNGQTFGCYRIIQILKKFAPKHKWVKEFSNSLQFGKYTDLYEKPTYSLFEKDPLYLEHYYFITRENPSHAKKLEEYYLSHKRIISYLSLVIEACKKSIIDYQTLLSLLSPYFKKEELTHILKNISDHSHQCHSFHSELYERLLQEQCYIEALQLVISKQLSLPTYNQSLDTLLEKIPVEKNPLLQTKTVNLPLLYSNSEKAERWLQRYVRYLLVDHSLTDVLQLLQPLKDKYPTLSIIKKLETMVELQDNPDAQRELGDLYHEFALMEKAIECYTFDMELHEYDPRPIQSLAKIYREIGQTDEATMYQQLYVEVRKRA